MLCIKDVSVSYGTHTVVNHLSFQVREGQWLMIVGPNGAGKSTILHAITQGVAYNGTILLQDTDIRKIKPAARAKKLGILTQNHYVGYDFTVEEVVRLGRYAHASKFLKGSEEQEAQAIRHALELTGMDAMRRQSVLTLSGGELQRTFLAQVFAQEPQLLLLDEPTNHLDLVYQKQVFALIQEWLRTPGRAVVSVVHDLSLAKAFGTHALLMHKGSAIAQGAIRDVLSSEQLDPVYQMDVCGWMKTMLSQWNTDTEV